MRKFILLCVVASLALTACGPKSDLVGKWNGEIPVGMSFLPAVFEFKPDGTMVTTASFQGINVVGNYTYTFVGGTLTATGVGFELTGNVTPQQKADSQRAFDQMKSVKEISKIRFIDKDTIEATDPQGGKKTWTRVK